VTAASRHLGSWGKALREAGFDPKEHRKLRTRWTREKAADWVWKRLRGGPSILARDVPPDLLCFVWKNPKIGWTDFVESLGVPYPGIKKRRDWTKAKVLSEIRRWDTEGHPLNHRAVADTYAALVHQARKFFGSWARARAKAGV
jgi:hypothetical protein